MLHARCQYIISTNMLCWSNQCIISIYLNGVISPKLMEIWLNIFKNDLFSACLLHCLVPRDFYGLQWLRIVKKCANRANQKGPVRILDSFMIRVPAASGSEPALAIIHAVQALASALRINRVLTQLRLHGNDVGVQGAQAHEIASNTSQDGQV